ncbi:hypothetical protein Poly51_39550 [Rubripirellula tenax]|uniref:Nickel uptake substrate-specific transmembrane region n=2 Tax=Rubripirellula tenax TaxID=2528015 RepID=A0A5C6ENN7_9BACT|nr:hypothetical protein Poly51_39550 [Rubripirellula tenax]
MKRRCQLRPMPKYNLLLASLFSVLSLTSALAQQATVTLSVWEIDDAGARQSVSDASITLWQGDDPNPAGTMTVPSGELKTNLPGGTWHFSAGANGYRENARTTITSNVYDADRHAVRTGAADFADATVTIIEGQDYKIEFALTADPTANQPNNDDPQVADDSGASNLTVRVWKDDNGSQTPVENARIIFWRGDDPQPAGVIDVTKPDGNTLDLPSGTWHFSAQAPGCSENARTFVTSSLPDADRHAIRSGSDVTSDVTMTFVAGAQYECDFVLSDSGEADSGPTPVPIFAIVSVRNTAKRIPDAQPKVDFFLAGADDEPLPGKVMPVSEEDLGYLGEGVGDDDPSKWNWYWVESEGPLPAGSYYARATLVSVDPVSSGYEAVETGKTNLFVLSLHPRDALGNLRGTVAEQINDSAKQPLVAWDVIATSQASAETRKTTTDRLGKYELKLSDGSWWVVCQPTENSTAESIDTAKLGAAKPVSVSITPQQDFTHDITIAQVTETIGPIVSQMAIIGVEGMIGDKLPTVQFGRSSAQAIDGKTRSLSEDELLDYGIEPEKDWSWFTAEPSSTLISGLYRAKATLSDLPNYAEQSSSQQSVSPDQSTYFQVIMPIQETPGSIQGRVVIAGTDPPELVPGATVTLTKLGSGNPPPPVQATDGNFSFKELTPGSWWVSASAADFDSTGAKTVAVKVNGTATVDLLVKKRVVPDTKLIALIGMEAGETGSPNVFYSNEDEPNQKRSLTVEPIDLATARKIGGGAIDPKFSYFIGKPSKPLPASSYRVHASSTNYSDFDSPAKKVLPGFETVVQAWLFRDQGPRLRATLHGHVLGHDPSGNVIEYVAGAKIKFIDASGFTVTEQTTDQNGYYLAEDLPSGRLEFEVIADSYQQERDGRLLDIRPSIAPFIFDFSVIKGESPTNPKTQLIVGVWTKNEFGEDVRVDDALVTITPIADAMQKRTATTLPETDCEFSVLPGYAYAVTATRSGFLPKSEQEIDKIFVKEDDDNRLKIYLQRAVDVRVLLTVLGGSGQGGQPTVYVKPTLGGAPLATVLTPVATQGLRNPREQQPAKMYWANVQTSLPAGEYFAEAGLSGYDGAQGDAKWLWGTDNTLYVTLTPPKDPSKKSYKLAGVVRRRGLDRTMSPFPGASITFENSARNRTRYAFADADGKYQIELDPDTWHANPVAPRSDASNSKVGYKPVSKQTTIIAGQQPANLDLVLIQDAEPVTPAALAQATAIIEVIANGKRNNKSLPIVEFTSRNIFTPNVRPISPNQYSRLEIPTNTTSDWFICIGGGLQPGPVSARATLGNLVDSTDPRPVHAGQPHTFWLQLGADEPEQTPGQLFVKVVEAGQQPTKYLDGAWIKFNRNEVETNVATLGGAYGPENIPGGTFAISAGAPGYNTSEMQWQSVTPGKSLELTIPLTPIEVTPSYTVIGSLRVVSVTGCGSKDAPTAMFVSETHGEVNATVSLQSDDGRSRNYNVTPSQPLVGGTWLLRADLDRLSAASQPKTIIASQTTTFMAQLDVPSPKIPLMVSVIDSDSKKPIPDASLQLKYPKNALRSVLSLKPSTKEFVEPGDYVLQATAPGYIASRWKKFQLGCEGEPKGSIALMRAPDVGKPTGDLIAFVQVVCAEKPVTQEYKPMYLNNARRGVTLVAFMADGTSVDAVPKVRFLEVSDNGITKAKHESELVELTPAQVLDATGIAAGDCEKWYRAEMKGLRIGKFKAEASLEDYATATSQPESMTSSTPGTFRLKLSKDGDDSGPGTLTVVVHSADEEIGLLTNATVNVKADNEVVQSRATNENGTVNFDVKAGLWSVSVQADSHANYSHAGSVEVPSGENKTIHVYLEFEMLPGPPPATVKVFVYAENATSDAKVPSLEVTRESVGMKSPVLIGRLQELPASDYTDEYPASKWKIYHAEGTTPGLGDVAASAQLENYTSLESSRKAVQTGKTTVLDVFLAPIRPNVDLIVKRRDTKEPVSSISLKIWDPTLGESFSSTTQRTTDSEGRVNDVQLAKMGSYWIAVATGSDQFTPFTSKDFEIKQQGSPIIVWLDPNSMGVDPSKPLKPINPKIASGGTVTPLEPPVAKLLCEFLEQRWQKPETAKELYREAAKVDPKKQVLPFAISLVEAKQENYKLVNALLGQVQQNDSFIWDRAVEARIRLGMLENDYPTVKQKISEFAGIYSKRPVSGASLETVRVMGLAIGAMNSLEGSQGNEQFQNSILAQLSSEYETAFNRGLAEAPKKPDSMVASNAGDGGDNSEMVKSNPNQKRIDELTAERKLKVTQRDQFERGSVQYQKKLGEIIALSNEIRNLESASTSTKTTTTTQTKAGQRSQSSFAAFAKLPLETWRMELIDQYSPCSSTTDEEPDGPKLSGTSGSRPSVSGVSPRMPGRNPQPRPTEPMTSGSGPPMAGTTPPQSIIESSVSFRATVKNAEDGQPIPNIEVSLQSPNSSEFGSPQITGLNGSVDFGMNEGTGIYKVRLSSNSLAFEKKAFVVIKDGRNEKDFQIRMERPNETFSVFGVVGLETGVMEEVPYTVTVPYFETITKDGKEITVAKSRLEQRTRMAERLRPVAGAKISLQSLRRLASSSSVETTTAAKANGFEFSDIPEGSYRLTATHQGRKGSTTVNVAKSDDSRRIGPIEVKLSSCESDYETLLATILDEGWETQSVAYQNYRLARAHRASDSRADYALALVEISGKRYKTAEPALLNVLTKSIPDLTWDRAAEAYLWIRLRSGTSRFSDTAKNIESLASKHYNQRPVNDASYETARLMGIGVGMLQGPWKDRHKGVDGGRLQETTLAVLNDSHAEAMRSGVDVVLGQFNDAMGELSSIEQRDQEIAERERVENARRINERMRELEAELYTIDANITREKSEGDKICDEVNQEAAPIKDAYDRASANLKDRTRWLDILRTRLRNVRDPVVGGFLWPPLLPQNDRFVSHPPLASPAVRLVSENRPGALSVGAAPILAQRFPVESYPNPQRDRIEQEIQMVTQQILNIQRRMAEFQASYNAVIARCTAATQQYNRYLAKQNARRKQISRELTALERQLNHNDDPPGRSIDAKRTENLSKSFNEYFSYPLEQRRQELLSSIGCGEYLGGGG